MGQIVLNFWRFKSKLIEHHKLSSFIRSDSFRRKTFCCWWMLFFDNSKNYVWWLQRGLGRTYAKQFKEFHEFFFFFFIFLHSFSLTAEMKLKEIWNYLRTCSTKAFRRSANFNLFWIYNRNLKQILKFRRNIYRNFCNNWWTRNLSNNYVISAIYPKMSIVIAAMRLRSWSLINDYLSRCF